MDTAFLPSVKRVTAMRLSMSHALCDSLAVLLAEAGKAVPPTITGRSAASARAMPADFTAYFDLLAALKASTPPATEGELAPVLERASASLRRLSELPCVPDESARPRVSTLSAEYFLRADMTSLIRWWDMEPDNAMDLQAIGTDELADAGQQVQRALDELEQFSPVLYEELLVVTRDIVIAKPGHAKRMNFGGVSSFAAWGAIGINHDAHRHWADYLRTMVHETAHLILFAAAREEPLVLNEASERKASPLRDDLRPVDGIFHAAFVSAREAMALDACMERLDRLGASADLQVRDHVENLLNDSVISFSDCCRQLDEHACLSPLGAKILQEARAYMDDAFELIA